MSNPRPRASRNSPRPTCSVSGPAFPIFGHGAHNSSTNSQRAQRCRAAQGTFRLGRLLPAIPSLHLLKLAVKILQPPLAKRRGWQCLFWGCSPSRESDDRLEAKIDRLLSEDGIDPAQFDYREEAGVQVRPKQPNQRSTPDRAAPDRAALPPGGHA